MVTLLSKEVVQIGKLVVKGCGKAKNGRNAECRPGAKAAITKNCITVLAVYLLLFDNGETGSFPCFKAAINMRHVCVTHIAQGLHGKG